MPVTVVDHPLAQHLLASLRDRNTPPPLFRTITKRLTIALMLWLVGGSFVLLFRRLGRSFEHRATLFFGLALAVIFVHSLFYNDFFEDPSTWALFGLGALAAAALEQRRKAEA